MDIHPSGFPGLVGPEGGYDFSHFDFSSHFRVLPNNGSIDAASPSHDTLPLRAHFQSPHLQVSPSNHNAPRLPQPLRVGDDSNSKNNLNNGNGKLGSPRPHHPLLGSDSAVLGLNSPPSRRLAHSASFPARLRLEETKHSNWDLTEECQIQSEEHLAFGL